MEPRVSIVDHERITVPVERSWLGYVWSTTGWAIVFTMAMESILVWSLLFPAYANEARVVRGTGKGFYDAASLTGAAAGDIKSYMDRTWVECDDIQGHGRCNLNASIESVQLRYVDDYAVVLLTYTNDTGNRPATRLSLWTKKGDNHYGLVAYTDDAPLLSDIVVTNTDGKLLLSGLTQGTHDGFCCPTKKTTFALTHGDASLKLSEIRSLNKNTRALGFDSAHESYAGENPFQYFHNNSQMMVFPVNGIIAYKYPKQELAGFVHETDIVFRGKIDKSGIVGTAYVFKRGCPPLPYSVSGPGYVEIYKGVPPTIVVKGFAPVHARNSCEVVGATAKGPNSVLTFDAAGAYGEDALEDETHSGYGYYDPDAK